MKTAHLFHFICQILALDHVPGQEAQIRDTFNSGRVDPDRFIHLASNHFVLPAIWHKLMDALLTDLFPEEYRIHLDELLQLNVQRNNEILKQVNEISAALAKENIEPVYMKGTGNLLAGLYPSPAHRMIGDIDILVQDKDFMPTATIIQTLGYKTESTGYDDPKELKDYPRMYREDIPADIEIHRVPVHLPFSGKFTTQQLFKDKLPSGQTNAFIPSVQYRLIHTFIHSQLSNKGHLFYTPGLRDIYDAYLLSQQVNWREVLEQIEEKEKARVFFEYMDYLFGPEQDFSTITNKATLKYIRRHRWFMDHPRWHRLYVSSYKLYELIFIRYLKRIFSALFNKKDLRYIFNRLKDPAWYGKHFKGIREQIFGKK